MQSATEFRLVPPSLPPAMQGGIPQQFPLGLLLKGRTLDETEWRAEARVAIDECLARAQVPRIWRAALAHALCEGTPPDPRVMVWLSQPARTERWRQAFDRLPYTLPSLQVPERACRLERYARALQRAPRPTRRHILALHDPKGALNWNRLPPLPDALVTRRDAMALVASIVIDHLYEALALPARQSRRDRVETVEGLGCFRVHFDAGTCEARLEALEAKGWVALSGHSADLLNPLSVDHWRQTFAYRFLPDIHRHIRPGVDPNSLIQLALRWVADIVRRLSEESGLVDHARTELREAYPVDAALMRDLTACTFTSPGDTLSTLTTARYAWGWRHAATLRQRLRDSANLAPVWALAVQCGLIGAGDDYDVLKAALATKGINDLGWRLLCNHSRIAYAPIASLIWPTDYEITALCEYVRTLQEAQISLPMHPHLAKAFLANYWFSGELPRHLPIGLVRGAVARHRECGSYQAARDFLDGELPKVLSWLARTKPELDANQQRAPWSWFVQRYREWDEAERRRREGATWTHGLDGLRWRGHAVVPIRDSLTLWQEGERLRLCLTNFEHACAKGTYVIYLVQSPDAGQKPVAVIGVELDHFGAPLLHQVRGFANRTVDPAIVRFAEHLVDLH